jgi:hypothetical protein
LRPEVLPDEDIAMLVYVRSLPRSSARADPWLLRASLAELVHRRGLERASEVLIGRADVEAGAASFDAPASRVGR